MYHLLGLFFTAFLCFPSLQGYTLGRECSQPLISVIGNHYSPPQKGCFPSSGNAAADRRFQKLQERLENWSDLKNRQWAGTDFSSLTSVWTSLKELALLTVHDKVIKPTKTAVICTGCKSVIQTVQYGLKAGQSEEDIISMMDSFCSYFNLMTEEICFSYLHLIAPPLLFIMNNTEASPDIACSYILPDLCDVELPAEDDWDIEVPPPLKNKPVHPPHKYEDGKKVLKVLHLSDTHFDKDYKEGSWEDCHLPLCCRDPPPNNESALAGKWGGWKCDIPERTLDSLLEFVVNNITGIDHVIWTGDIPAHDLWGQSKESNLDMINITISKLKNYFPYESVVLPSIGNHEPVPGNLLPPPSYSQGEWSNDWLYESLAHHWTSPWLQLSKSETIRKGGYYVTAYRPGLLMISLNSVFCYNSNWWLILDNKDPGDELAWLVETLAQAELLGEKVHISAHVPPGNVECLKAWRKNYNKIIERFKETVVAQFFGHTHYDEFELILRSSDPNETVAALFVGPSATTYTMLNPGFRIYYIDGDYEGTTRKVLDYETWIMDLEESNRIDSAIWKKLYTAKEDFGMESLEVEEWRKLYERIKTDDDYLQKYHRYYWKDSPKRPECGDGCRENLLCQITPC